MKHPFEDASLIDVPRLRGIRCGSDAMMWKAGASHGVTCEQVKAMLKFSGHDVICARYDHGQPCDCGFAQALADYKQLLKDLESAK